MSSGTDSSEKQPDSKFLIRYGNGRKPDHLSKVRFMSDAGQAAVEDLRDVGTFRKTSGNRLFYCLEAPRTQIIELADQDIRLKALIRDKFYVNPASKDVFNHIVAAMQMEAYQHGKVAEVHQFVYLDRKTKTGYVSLMNGKDMLRLSGWKRDHENLEPEVVPNGTDGVFFLDPPTWEPWTYVQQPLYETEHTSVQLLDEKGNEYEEVIKRDYFLGLIPVSGVAKKYLVDPIKFTETQYLSKEDQRWLFEMWLKTLMLDLVEKPLLLMYGAPGSGKTSSLQLVKKALYGGKADVDSTTKEDDFIAAVTNSPLVILDNVDDCHERWLPNHLAKVSTGQTFSKRALYQTNTLVEYPSRAAVGMTAWSPQYIDSRPDLADRTLVFNVERVKGDFRDKDFAFEEVRRHRNEILSDLVNQLHEYINFWRGLDQEEGSPLRMAGFGVAMTRFAKVSGNQKEIERAEKIIGVLQGSQVEVLIQHDSLIVGLDEWLAKHPNQKCYSGTAGDVAKTVTELTGYRTNAIAMGRRISAMWGILEKRYGATKTPNKKGSPRYTFYQSSEPVDGKSEVDRPKATCPEPKSLEPITLEGTG
jgi:hypothetical protein